MSADDQGRELRNENAALREVRELSVENRRLREKLEAKNEGDE